MTARPTLGETCRARCFLSASQRVDTEAIASRVYCMLQRAARKILDAPAPLRDELVRRFADRYRDQSLRSGVSAVEAEKARTMVEAWLRKVIDSMESNDTAPH